MSNKAKKTRSEIESIVIESIRLVATEKKMVISSIEGGQHIVFDLGFHSMDQVRLIAKIEMALKVDPFIGGESVFTETTTVHELCDIYESYLFLVGN